MANQTIPTVPTAQELPSRVQDFRALPKVEWSRTAGRNEGMTKSFDGGNDRRWDYTKDADLDPEDIYHPTGSDYFEIESDERNEQFFIAYLDLDTSRHFRVINSMGFEWKQDGTERGALYLNNVGREYKHPVTGQRWSYADSEFGRNFQNRRGEAFLKWDLSRDEINMQEGMGYVLNRIYFHVIASGSGSSHTGSPPATSVQIYNLKFGWGTGSASTNHRICLPKVRAWSDAAKPQYG